MRVRTIILALLIISLFYGQPSAWAQDDPFNLAMKAYQEKNYPVFLENITRVGQQLPSNIGILELVVRAQVLNGKNREALTTLAQIAKLGAVIDLTGIEFKSLKEDAGYQPIAAAFTKNNLAINNSQPAFVVAEKDLIPEGIAYDEQEKVFYLGSIHKRKIIRISLDGKASDFTSPQQDGMLGVLGLKVDARRRHLWVCATANGRDKERDGSSTIFKYDLKSKKLIKKFEIDNKEQPHIFNDVVINSKGDAYFTDSTAGAVFIIPANGETFQPLINTRSFIYTNGIALSDDERFLIIADQKGISRYELATKKLTPIAHAEDISLPGFDGLYWYKGGLVAVQNGYSPERIVRIVLNKTLDRVERVIELEKNNPQFVIPTTGAIAPDGFYYIATSYLRNFGDNGELVAPEKLKEILIFKIPTKVLDQER